MIRTAAKIPRAYPFDLGPRGDVMQYNARFEEEAVKRTADQVQGACATAISQIVRAPAPIFASADSLISVAKVEFGVGKTHATIKAMVTAVREGRETGDTRPFLFVGPTHNQLSEVFRDLAMEGMRQGVTLRVGHYYSQSANAKPDGENTPCLLKSKVDELLRVSGTASSLCGTKGSGYCPHSQKHDNAKKRNMPPCMQHQGLQSLKDADIMLVAGDSVMFGQIPGPIKAAAKARALAVRIPGHESITEDERAALYEANGQPNLFRLIVLDEFAPQSILQEFSGEAAPKLSALSVDLIAAAQHLTNNVMVNATVRSELLGDKEEDERLTAFKVSMVGHNLATYFAVLSAVHGQGRHHPTPEELLMASWQGCANQETKLARLLETRKLVRTLRPNVGDIPLGDESREAKKRTRELLDFTGDLRAVERLLDVAIDIVALHEPQWREAKNAGEDYLPALSETPEIAVWATSSVANAGVDIMRRRPISEAVKNTPVLMLDATADHAFNRRILPNYTIAFDEQVEPNAHVRHYHVQGNSYSHSQLTWGAHDVKGVLKAAQKQVIRLVWHTHRARKGITLLILPKALADYLRQRPHLLPPLLPENMSDDEALGAEGVVLMHFGDTRGRNGGKHARTHIQLGRQLPPRMELERMAAVIARQPLHAFQIPTPMVAVPSADGNDVTFIPYSKWPDAPHAFHTTDGQFWYDNVPDHPADYVMELYRAITVDEYEQALGRSRGTRRTADNPLMIISGGDVPLRRPVTAPISEYELQAITDVRLTPLAFGMHVESHWVSGNRVLFAALQRDDSQHPNGGMHPELANVMLCDAEDSGNAYRLRRDNPVLEILDRAASSLSFNSARTVDEANAMLADMPVATALLNLEARAGYVPAGIKGPDEKRRMTVCAQGPKKEARVRLAADLPGVDVGPPSQRNTKKTKVEHEVEITQAMQQIASVKRKLADVERSIFVDVDGTIYTAGLALGHKTVEAAGAYLHVRLHAEADPDAGTRYSSHMVDRLETFPEAVKAVKDAEAVLAALRDG